MRKRLFSFLTAALIGFSIHAQERGTPIFSDNFDVEGTFIENWKPTKGVINEAGTVNIPRGGGLLGMNRDMPDEFYASVKMKMAKPIEADKAKWGFGGFTIGPGNVFVVRPDGNAWMVYRVPNQKTSGGAIKKIESFEYGKPYTLTLIKKQMGKESSMYVFLLDGKQVGQAVLANPPKNTKLSLFSHRENVIFDDFQLFSLKKDDGDSPNMAVNSSFEHLQEGMPTYFDTDTMRRPNLGAQPYENYLKTFVADTKEKHSGKQSLRMIFDDSASKQGFQTFDTGAVVGQPITYSLYLKADQDDFPAVLTIWEMRTKWHRKEIKLSKKWQRYDFTLAAATRPSVRVGLEFKKHGTIWADDIQVEIGDKATAYKPSNLDTQKFTAKRFEYVKIPPITVKKLNKIPAMDGNLDSWKNNAAEFGKFYFKDGRPQNDTKAYIGCDNENLYLGIRAYCKDLSAIKAKQTNDDDFKIFEQENIEILLDPGKSQKNYYQLVCSAAGSKSDLGPGRNPKWNGDWSVAVKRNPQEKSIDYEIRLPLATFATASAANQWGINIGRSDSATREASAILPYPEPNFHKVEGYPALNLPADVIQKYAVGITDAKVTELDGGKLLLSGEIENNTGKEIPGTLTAVSAPAGKMLGSCQVQLKQGKMPFRMEALPYDLKNSEIVFLLNADGKRVFAQMIRPEKFSSVSICGKYNYYMREPEAEFRVRCAVAQPEKLTAVLKAAGQTVSMKAAENFVMKLPLKGIADGTYPVSLELWNGGVKVGGAQTILVRKPYQKGAVQINQYRRCLASEGKNILPFMPLISVWPHDTDKSIKNRVDFLEENGFKSVMIVISRNALNPSMKFLEYAGQRGIQVIYWNHWKDWNNWKNTTWETVEAVIRDLSKNGNILGQLVLDEPELYMKSEDAKAELTRMRKYFPYHPTFMNNTIIGIPNRFADHNTDILMLDDYLTNRENRTVREIVDQVDLMWNIGAAEHRPCYYFLVGNNMHNHYREPSAAEQYAQTYGSLAANCTGFTYFMGIPSYPEHWKAYLALNREILALNDIVLSEEEVPKASVSDAKLRHITRKQGGFLYVIAVNIDDSPSENVAITLPAEFRYDSKAEVLFENRTLKADGGKITDSFPGYSRHVYKVKIK